MGRGTNGIFGKQFGLGFGVDRCQFMKNDTVVAVVQDPAKVFRRQAWSLWKVRADSFMSQTSNL